MQGPIIIGENKHYVAEQNGWRVAINVAMLHRTVHDNDINYI
jgi:hypothetical protein